MTTASGLIGAHPRGASQVIHAAVREATVDRLLVSRADSGAPGAGASGAPSLTAGGEWVLFQTAAPDAAWGTARGADANRITDIAFWLPVGGARLLLARSGASRARFRAGDSPHGNYVVFDRDGQVWLNYVGPK